MKKNYMAPVTEIYEAQLVQMIAGSLTKSEESADNSEVLVHGNKDWNIWDSDDVED